MNGHMKTLPHDLATLIGSPDAPTLVDICLPEDHALDPRLVPAARRMTYRDAATDTELGRHKPCVIICQKGFKLSQGVAASLRAEGLDVSFLEGGMVGWAQAGLPLLPADLHALQGQTQTRWVIREDTPVADFFNAWTVLRFIDPAARFLFVEPSQVDLVADRFDAGTLSAAETLRNVDSSLKPYFAAMGTALHTAPISELIKAHSARTATSAARLQQGFVILDALWSSAGEVGA